MKTGRISKPYFWNIFYQPRDEEGQRRAGNLCIHFTGTLPPDIGVIFLMLPSGLIPRYHPVSLTIYWKLLTGRSSLDIRLCSTYDIGLVFLENPHSALRFSRI
jgi:hypothetical protein